MLCSTPQQPSNWTTLDALSPSKSTAAFPRPAHFAPGTHKAALRLSAKVANLQRTRTRGFGRSKYGRDRAGPKDHIRVLSSNSEKRMANSRSSRSEEHTSELQS